MQVSDSASSATAQQGSRATQFNDKSLADGVERNPLQAGALPSTPAPGTTLRDLANDGTQAIMLARGETAPGGGPSVDGYAMGPAKKPDFQWDEGFVHGSAATPTLQDATSRIEWLSKLRAAQLVRPDLSDATRAYEHYWSNTGAPLEIDFAKAYREDSNVKLNVDGEVVRTAAAVDAMATSSGRTSFEVSGPGRSASAYPSTENWQKTIGAYQQWSSANVRVDGDRITMTVKVHEADHYNFNRDQNDIATNAPDNANGRFTELGWAKPFDTHGEITRTISWTRGHPPSAEQLQQLPAFVPR